MSSVGDYVHLHKENYIKYSITNDSDNHVDPTHILSEMKNAIKINYTNNDLASAAKKIEDAYNEILYNKNNNDIKKIILEILTKQINEEFNNNLVVTQNYDVQEREKKKDLQSIFNSTINNINQIIQSNVNMKNKDIEGWKKEIENIEKFINDNSEYIKNLQGVEKAKQQINEIKTKIYQKGKIPTKKDIKNSISDIQDIINEYNQINTDISNPKGRVGEFAVALVSYVLDLKAQNTADEEIKEALKNPENFSNWNKKIKGNKYDKLQYVLSGFEDIDEATYNKIIKDKKNNEKIGIKVTSKRSKSDVIFTFYLENNNKDIIEEEVKMSVKNSSGQNLKLADSTPLYDILRTSGNMDFINHYLNIITINTREKDANKFITSEDRRNANLLVRILTVRVALKGYSSKNAANYLGVNDIENKKFHVYSIPLLVNLLEQNYEQHKYYNMISGLALYYTIKQKKEDTVRKRIGIILDNLRKKKISVQGKKAVWFNAYDNFLKNNKRI